MKSPLKLPREQIEALRPGDVRQYLTSRGWIPESDGTSSRAVEFHHPKYRGVELLLLLKREVGDFVLRMADIVVGLATVEERSAWDVLNDLSGPPGDVFRLRVVAPDSTLGNLPLDEGIQLLRGGRDLLAASACSAAHAQTLHPQRMPREVREFLKTCRLGQTERGSFVATIITPVPPEIPTQTLMKFAEEEERLRTEPYARRVTTRLMSTLGFVSEAIQTGKPGRILQGVEQGVSANFCEALKEMKPSGDQSRLDISVSWARTRGHVPENLPQTVSFPQESFSFIEEAGRELRIRAFAKPAQYQGKLITTEWVRRPFTPEEVGRIIIATEVGGQSAKVKVDLTPADFRRACDALPTGKRVTVTGVIRNEVKTREYELSEVRDFQVLDEK
jgi:hypothetical protein